MKFLIKILLLLSITLSSQGLEKDIFDDKTLDEIKIQLVNKPFILTFWSKECVYCNSNFKRILLAKIKNQKIPKYAVCIDCLNGFDNFASSIKEHKIDSFKNYLMTSTNKENIMFRIDSKWGGETPRTYLFDAKHSIKSFSGLISKKELKEWLENISKN